MAMKTTGELMLPLAAFPYIPYWFSLRQALSEIESDEAQRGSARVTPWIMLIFDAQNHFLGLIQRQDILRGLRTEISGKLRELLPTYVNEPADLELSRLSFSAENALVELRERLERRIIEFMTPLKITLDYNDPILLSIHLMIERGLTFVPVVQNGRIVGILDIEDALVEVVGSVL